MVGKMVQSDTLRFVKEFLASPSLVGAINASSESLAAAVTEVAGVARSTAVVEFGPGTGAITSTILKKLPRDAKFFAIEISDKFVETMHKNFPEVKVFHDSAVNTRRYMEEMGIDHCDCIVSGLPWASFNDGLQHALLDATFDVLKSGGRFVTFMYVMSPLLPAGGKFMRRLRARFGNIQTSKPVWANVPPALVISAEKE